MAPNRWSDEQLPLTVLDALAEGVVVQGADGRVLACNPAAERILGLPLDGSARIAPPAWELVWPDGSPAGGADLRDAPFIPVVRDALIEAMFASASNILLFPVQDVFGWADRINEPATVSDDNWTYRLPWPADRLDAQPDARERQSALRRLAETYGRA